MPKPHPVDARRPYAGQHRGRHRAPVQRSSRGLTLPGAAAAALTLTATGAAVIPGISAGAAVADSTPVPPPTQQQDAAGSEANDIADIRADLRQAELVEQASVRRAEARARASRDAARKRIQAEKEAELAAARTWVLPIESYRFTSPFGSRWGRLHAGNDFAAPTGTPLAAMSGGTVVLASSQSGYGLKVEIRYWDGTVSWYAHMSRIDVSVGDEVEPGQIIGAVGNTGHSTGSHLHLEVHPDGGGPVDPLPWLKDKGLDV